MKINKAQRQLFKKAGFYLWSNESWKPKGAVIDWAANYDKEILKLIQLVREEERFNRSQDALNKMADNAKELGLDYEN